MLSRCLHWLRQEFVEPKRHPIEVRVNRDYHPQVSYWGRVTRLPWGAHD
jgi:hypothetical protein